jgi:hypothetical protein
MKGTDMKLSQNFSFWESKLRCSGKSGPLAAFSKAISETNRVLGMAHIYRKIKFLPFLAVLALTLSCSDFFTTSLASWAQRDPSKLIPPVNAGNVGDLILLTESSPDQSLALLERIAGANAANPSPELQTAAVTAATNASGIGTAILQHAGDITGIDATNVESIAVDAINSLSNAVEAGAVLESILPDPADPEWGVFVAAASAEDLAMAAVVILAGRAKGSGDPAAYISGFTSTPGDIATELAEAALAKPDHSGLLADILSGLKLNL